MRVLTVVAFLVSLVACGRDGRDELVVLAASSLAEPFAEVATAFERGYPGVDVVFSFGGSSDLARQIEEGVGADVFVSADVQDVERLGGRLEAAVVIARNRLAIAVPEGNPTGIADLADLARDGLVVVLCDPRVPCGRYASSALEDAEVHVRAASRERHVRAVLAKVRLREADAGIVYRTDRADGVELVAVAEGVVATYPAAVVRGARRGDVASRFVAFLRSGAGQGILAAHGFDVATR